MRILKILQGSDAGGVYTCETQFIKYWVSRGVIVDVIILGDGNALERYKSIASNYQVIENLDANYSGSPINILLAIRKAIKFAYKYKSKIKFKESYDAIIYRRPVFIHFAGELSKLLGAKVYWHLPNFINRKFGRFYYSYYMKSYGVEPVANSHYTKDTVGEQCKHVIYPGFDPSRIKATNESFRSELGISASSKVFGIAARINHTKAQDLVIKAMVNSGAFKKICILLLLVI